MSIFFIAGLFLPNAEGKLGHGANLLKTWNKLSEVTAGTMYVIKLTLRKL